MSQKNAKSTRSQFSIDFGRRLRDAVDHKYGDKNARMEFERGFLQDVVGTDRAKAERSEVFRRWYAGANLPNLYVLSRLIADLNEPQTNGHDANYFLTGYPSQRPNLDSFQNQVLTKLDKIHDQTQFLRDYTEDHEFGIEGVVMRQSIRLLQDIASTHKQAQEGQREREERELTNLHVAGILTDDLLEILEGCASWMRLATVRLDYLVSAGSNPYIDQRTRRQRDDPSTSATTQRNPTRSRPGRMLNVVTDNLMRGCHYTYLLPEDTGAEWPTHIAAIRKKLVNDRSFSNQHIDELMHFRTTSMPLGAGFVLLDFIPKDLSDRRPALEEELREYTIDSEKMPDAKTIGYVVPPAAKTHACMLMDKARLDAATRAWDTYYKSSIDINLDLGS